MPKFTKETFIESDFELNGGDVELDGACDLAELSPLTGESSDYFFTSDDLVDEPNLWAVDDADDDSSESDSIELPTAIRKPRAKPTPVSSIAKKGEAISIYDCLVEYGLLKKITDIVMAKVSMPWHLRADATQEIHCAWASLKAKPTFAQNQVAHYAYLSGQHAALKLRRVIGAVVVIPGALFRTGRDTAFMESIGAALNPKDVDDYKDSLELSVEMLDSMERVVVDESFVRDRLSGLALSSKQRLVAERALLRKMSADDIATELQITVATVERMLNQVATKLNQKDIEASAKFLA